MEPGGDEIVVANGVCDMRDNFGGQFTESTIEMTPTKQAHSIVVKSFSYSADIKVKKT